MRGETITILYLSYDGLTDPLGQSQVLPYLKGLCAYGYSFHILSFEKQSRYTKGRERVLSQTKEFSITWHPRIYHKKPPILSTLYDMYVMYRSASRLIKAMNIQLVHARSYLSGMIAARLKRKLPVKFLFDMRGFWADERVDGNIWNLKNPMYRMVYRYVKSAENRLIDQSDHIISLTHSGKDEIVSGRLTQSTTTIAPEKVSVIPCSVDLELFDPARIEIGKCENLREVLKIPKGANVWIYLGSIGTWYLLDEMLSFFGNYLKADSQTILLFVTMDPPDGIYQAAQDHGVPAKSIRVTMSSREEVPMHLSLATVGYYFIKSAYSKKASSATKMGEMLAMGLPIVTNCGVGDSDEIISKYGCGQVVDMHSEVMPLLAPYDSAKSYKAASEYFSLDAAISTYQEAYSQA